MTQPTYFSASIADIQRRSRKLLDQAGQQPEADRRFVSVALEELNAALDELRVADEELRQQNVELEAAAERAHAEHRRYYTLFEFAPIGLLVSDGRGVIREANRAAAALFACERPYLLGKPIAALLDELSGRQVRDLMARAFTASGPASCWGSTSPGRGSPRRIIITIEADIAGDTDDPRIRWAIQPKGTPDIKLFVTPM